MNKLYLYNTLGRKRQEFKPIKKASVGFYHCGPTVYWTQHIGNLRGMLCGDIMVRSLRYLGYKVKQVRNYTDVGHLTSDQDEGEDKMAKAAKRDKMPPQEVAAKYIKIFESDTDELNILEPNKKPRATEYIKDMIKMVQVLMDKGFAYSTDLAVYFDVTKAKNYGSLSGQDFKDKSTGAGKGEVGDRQKKHQVDFALWFFRAGAHAQALQYWPSPFKSGLVKNGQGFPGWHIECSAMSKKLLGDTIDIHLGGIEHVPVHHTNEIAQSEAANGVKFVNYWLHNEHLLVDNKKMAKSEGTGFSLAEVRSKGFSSLALRYFFLQAHYRSKENFTWQALGAAKNGLSHLMNQVKDLGRKKGQVDKNYKEKFIKALADDFNTPQALAVVQEMLKSDLQEKDKLATILDFDNVLGLNLADVFKKEKLPIDIKKLVKARIKARQEKNWPASDDLRKQLEVKGYLVEDSQAGMRVRKK